MCLQPRQDAEGSLPSDREILEGETVKPCGYMLAAFGKAEYVSRVEYSHR